MAVIATSTILLKMKYQQCCPYDTNWKDDDICMNNVIILTPQMALRKNHVKEIDLQMTNVAALWYICDNVVKYETITIVSTIIINVFLLVFMAA